MEVYLKRDYFGPDMQLYRKSERLRPTTVPDGLKLPSDAVIVKGAPRPIPQDITKRLVNPARENDVERSEMEAADAAAEKAEKFRLSLLAEQEAQKQALTDDAPVKTGGKKGSK